MSTTPATAHSEIDEPEFQALKAEVADWVSGAGERWSGQLEAGTAPLSQLWDELQELGYLRLAAPVELGGRGLPFVRYLELLELFSRSHGSVRMVVHVANGIWRAVAPHADAKQVQRFVRPQVAGELKVAFTLTEPHVGTGADIAASVEREGDTYYLSGEKHLITFGRIADYLLLAARVAGSHGAQGTLALMVPAHGEGVRNDLMGEAMGLRGTDHSHLTFDRAPVPVANRLGAEGEGLEVMIGGFLVPSRISVGMSCVGLAQRALDEAIAYSHQRVTFGKPIAKRQAISFSIAQAAAELQAARQLVLYAAAQWERDPASATGVSAMAKLFASQTLQSVTDRMLNVFGGIGYLQSPIERIYRDARAQRFEEGSYEIQQLTIAKELLG